jgi:hypothetical protein
VRSLPSEPDAGRARILCGAAPDASLRGMTVCGLWPLPPLAGAGFKFHLVHMGVVDVCD